MRTRAATLKVWAALLAAMAAAMLVALAVGNEPAKAAFPGANGKIAFSSDRVTTDNPTGDFEIFTMNPDGTNVTQLTFNEELDGQPAWSPDGSMIAFTSERDGDPEIYTMFANGLNQANFTKNSASDRQPAWHREGTVIDFSSDRDGDIEVYRLGLGSDPSQAFNMTNNDAVDSQPAFPPKGDTMVFGSNRDGNFEVYLRKVYYPPQGGSIVRFTNLTNNPASELDPAWSPGGKKIAFSSFRDGNNEIYVMNRDGSGQRNRSKHFAMFDIEPAWSPNGKKIVFTSDRDVNFEIYVMNRDGSRQRNLTNNSASDVEPDWQPIVP